MALQFVIKADDQVSPAANKAASNLYRLDAAIKNESAALKALTTQMKAVSATGDVTSDKFKKLSGAIAEQRSKLGGLKDQMHDAGGLPKAAGGASLFDDILKKLSGTLGSTGGLLGKLGPYGKAAAAGLGLVTAAATIAGGAVAYLAVKLLELGVAASETKGDTARSLELLYGSEKAALHTYRVISSLTQDIAISQGRALELSDSLIKAGMVNGDRMVAAIGAIGKAEAARAGAGKVLEGVITRSQQSRMFGISRSELMQVGLSYRSLAVEISKGTGMAVGEAELRLRTGGVKLKAGLEALNRVIDSKMGDLANKKMMTVGAQAQRLKDTFGRLFENVNTGALARLLQVVGNMLDESNVSGHALRTVLTKMFDEMAAAAETVAPYLQAFFEGGILMALKLYNALYPVRQAVAKMFGGDSSEGVKSFEDRIIGMADTVGKGFTVAAVAIAYMIENAGKLVKIIDTLIVATPGIGVAFVAAKATIDKLTSNIGAGNDVTQARGKNVAEGVATGIRQGTPAVEAAMAAMATKGTAAFDQKMQIKSPSRLMMIRGRYIDEGLAKGVNDNSDAPAKAAGNMAGKTAGRVTIDLADRAKGGAAPGLADRVGRPPGPPASPSSGGGAGDNVIHVTFAAGSVVLGGSDSQTIRQAEDKLSDMMANVIEKVNRIRATGSNG